MKKKKVTNHILSLGELAYLSLFTLIALPIVNAGVIIDTLFSRNALPTNYFYDEISNLQNRVPDFVIDFIFSPSVGTFILWGALGFIVYLLLISFQSEVGTLFSKFKVSVRYNHPKQYKQFSFWLGALLELIYPIIVLIVLLLWTWLCIKVLIPFSSIQILIVTYESLAIIDVFIKLFYAFISLGLVGVGYIVIVRTIAQIKSFF